MEKRSLPISSKSLADILEGFNRKERNLLIRDILGHSKEKLCLSADFLQRIHDATGVILDTGAWWATDYHFDWLFAAVMVLLGKTKPGQVQADDLLPLMTATQQDADLVIADGRHLILIEAKAYGACSNAQTARKRQRFDQLQKLAGKSLDLRFVLMSPKPPQKLDDPNGAEPLPWLQLKVDPTRTVCRVERCDAAGKTGKAGGHWTIVALPASMAVDDGSES